MFKLNWSATVILLVMSIDFTLQKHVMGFGMMKIEEENASSKDYDDTLVYPNENHIESLSISDGNIHKPDVPVISNSVFIKRAAGLADEETINSIFSNGSGHMVQATDYDGTLVYSNENHIESLSIIDGSIEKSKLPLISNSLFIKHASGLAIDYECGTIIYGDHYEGTINSVFFNGSGHMVLARDQGEVIRMEFDPNRRILYWVYQDTIVRYSAIKYIEITREGTRATDIKTLHELPLLAYITGIALDDCGLNIFWGQCSRIHGTAIYKTNLVHFAKDTVISSDISRPFALTVDQERNQLYWSDKWLYKIERCDFDGRHRVVIAQGDDAATVYGMTIYGDYLYWTDASTEALYRANKLNGGDLTVVENYLKDAMDVVVIVNNTNQCVKNPL